MSQCCRMTGWLRAALVVWLTAVSAPLASGMQARPAPRPEGPLRVVSVSVQNERGGEVLSLGSPNQVTIKVQNAGQQHVDGVYVEVGAPRNMVLLDGARGDARVRSLRLGVGGVAPGAVGVASFGVLPEEPTAGFFGKVGGNAGAVILVSVGGQGVPVRDRAPFDLTRVAPTRVAQAAPTPSAAPSVAQPAVSPVASAAPTMAATVAPLLASSLPTSRLDRSDAIAVIVGNRTYRRAPAVEYAANDVAAMRLYAERVLGIRPGNILVAEDASLSDMKVLFGDQGHPDGRLKDLVKPGRSEVFVFYSGHGAPDPTERRAYLMPVDADANRLALTGMPIDVLYDNLAALGARHVTVVIDACFSGASGGGPMLITAASPIGIQVNDPSSKFAGSQGTIIAAAQGQQLANWQTEQKHGMLTYYFLLGLRGAADTDRDGSVSVGEMRRWLTDATDGLPYEARRLHGRDQMPQVWGADSYRLR